MKNFSLLVIVLFTVFSCGQSGTSESQSADDTKEVNSVAEEQANEKIDDDSSTPKGLSLIKGSDCLACHMEEQKLVGPSYKAIAEKYRGNDEVTAQLVTNIIK